MEAFAVGDVVVVPFTYSDLTKRQLRPALVVKKVNHTDYLLVMITTKGRGDPRILPFSNANLDTSGLEHKISVIRYSRMFVAEHTTITKKLGFISSPFATQIKEAMAQWILE